MFGRKTVFLILVSFTLILGWRAATPHPLPVQALVPEQAKTELDFWSGNQVGGPAMDQARSLFDEAQPAAGPDLVVNRVNRAGLNGDWQSLEISGMISAEIANAGNAPVAGTFTVIFFEDTNNNQDFDAGVDAILGDAVHAAGLAGGETVTVSGTISGQVPFRDNLIYAVVDSNAQIPETDETNNLSHTGLACRSQPPSGPFEPVLEWSWTGSTVEPAALNVMMTPAVIDLNDDGIPDVVFATTAGSLGRPPLPGPLRAVSGDTGQELFSVASPAYWTSAADSVAAGDIDLDGRPEIVAVHGDGDRLIAFEHDGTFKWESDKLETVIEIRGSFYASWAGGPALADLDGDIVPEIIHGRQVLNNDGSIRWTGTGGRGDLGIVGPLSLVADIDLDGVPEIVAGNTVYDASGNIVWEAPFPDGYNAVANFDGDPQAEIVLISDGQVYLFEHDGVIKWGPVSNPERFRGGPPTVADYDNDGQVEIGVAGSTWYSLFETDGTIKWSTPVEDSSGLTGSSVFDFDGDGAAEVIYSDNTNLFVFQGTSGDVLFETALSSGTLTEYPLVVDVDADGSAEIVAAANNIPGQRPQQGIFVYGDPAANWVATRQIWNQHTYHITNINDDGSIPSPEANNWLSFNNYRQNLPADRSPLAAPDLTASFLRLDPGDAVVTMTARIGNGGSLPAPAGPLVAFYNGQPGAGGSLIGVVSSQSLAPGQFEEITLPWLDPISGSHKIYVVVDDDGTEQGAVNECDETNNIHAHTVIVGKAATGSLTISLELDPPGGRRVDFSGDLGSFTLADGQSERRTNLPAAAYRVTEMKSAVPDETWTLLAVICLDQVEPTSPFSPTVTETAEAFAVDIPLAAGQQLECTFRNERSTFEQPGGDPIVYLPLIVKPGRIKK